MNRVLVLALLSLSVATLPTPSAQAQATAPDFPAAAPAAAAGAPTPPATANARQSPAARARDERRQRMTPEEARRDQQLEILESRTGTSNTSFSRGASQARQYEKRGGAFTVKKFKDKRPTTKRFKRGQSRMAGGIDPKGERLIDKKRKKRFGIF